jgi:predicted pyridoxine 5'-phosphate oxidase superfamily flavin-nucleotide-binding protein
LKILDSDIQAIISETILCFAATINQDGSPNLSPKSTLKVFDDNHLIFANIASPKTTSNLKRDPRIEINCVDIFSRRGYRFKGRGVVHSIGTQIHDDLLLEIKNEHGNSIPVIDAILIEVLEVKPVLSPAYTFIKGVTENNLREAYMKKYNVRPLNEEHN